MKITFLVTFVRIKPRQNNLKELELTNNHIVGVEGLDKLTNLLALSPQSNQITRLEGFGKLANLQSLDLRLNPVENREGDRGLLPLYGAER